MPTFDVDKHEYSIDGRVVPSVTQVLRAGGVVDDRWFTEESRIRGSLIHRLVLLQSQDDLDESSVDPRPEIKGRWLAWKKFLRESGFTPYFSEHLVYSPTYDFAGTFDTMGHLNGRWVLLDFKTGIVPVWAGMQLAAYSLAAVENGLERPARRYGLHLKEDANYKLVRFHDDMGDLAGFIQCLQKSRGMAV